MSILGQPITGLTLGFGGRSWKFPLVIPIDFSLQVAGPYNPPGFIVTTNFCQIANAGLQFIVTVLDENQDPLDISGATSLILSFINPDGSFFQKTAAYVTNGIDGQIYYVTTASDLLEAGLCYIQGQFTIGGVTMTTAFGQFATNNNAFGPPAPIPPLSEIILIDANGVPWRYQANTDGRLIVTEV